MFTIIYCYGCGYSRLALTEPRQDGGLELQFLADAFAAFAKVGKGRFVRLTSSDVFAIAYLPRDIADLLIENYYELNG